MKAVRSRRLRFTVARLVLGGTLLVGGLAGAREGGADGDWPRFGNDAANTRYSPLDQINRDNFSELELAWSWQSISLHVTEATTKVKPGRFKAVPVVVDGIVYVASEISQVAAIDGATGETLWEYDPESWKLGRPANIGWQHRGVVHWRGEREDGREDARIFLAAHDRKLIALDARTGEPVGEFGEQGVVDLLPNGGLDHFGRRVNWRHLTHSSPPAIVGNTIVVGSIVHDGAIRRAAPPGHVRGFDVRTGELKWVFHTIAQEGEVGVETWEDGSWEHTGNTNVWSMMAVDEELGYIYLPISTPTNDFYGGHRLGDNLYAESLVCLDGETGERVWHFQAIHHGLWDYDFPTAPNLLDITVGGRRIKAVAQVSKQAFTYVFDRMTGEPVWPIVERPVPASDVPGERSSATQPFPTKPPPFDRQGTSEEVLVDFTPEIKSEALKIASQYKLGPLYTPPSLGKGLLMLPSAGGGANWPGAAVDPEAGVLYVPSSTGMGNHPLSQPDPARSNLRYVGSYFAGARGPKGLPLVKPPWGRVTAIDLNSGEQLWMTPNGFGPRSHPALADLDLPPLGGGSGAPLLTKALLFVTQSRGLGDENSPRINVFDKKNGELLGHIPLPDSPNGNPVTYLHGGRQHLVVAVGGGPFFGGYSEDDDSVDPEFAQLLKLMDRGGTMPQLVAFRLP